MGFVVVCCYLCLVLLCDVCLGCVLRRIVVVVFVFGYMCCVRIYYVAFCCVLICVLLCPWVLCVVVCCLCCCVVWLCLHFVLFCVGVVLLCYVVCRVVSISC